MLPERNGHFEPMGKLKSRINIRVDFSVSTYLKLETNGPKMACQFAFGHNTSKNSSTETTPYEIVFGFKPQIAISQKLGLVRDDNDLCHSEFCQSLPNHTHVNKETSPSCIDNLLSSKS